MTIDLDIRHTYRGDLLVKLYKEDDSVIIFDGFASASPSSHDVILTGEVVEGFEGYLAEGTWTLSIIDRLNGDVGYLNYWALNFELE